MFDTYCILGDPAVPPLWTWRQWSSLLASLDPIVAAARGRAGVRSIQNRADGRDTVKFGRIGWNRAGHQKWTHGSPANSPDSLDWKFLNVEVWAPSWTTCEREGQDPDVFLAMNDQGLGGAYALPPTFNPLVIFAVRSELARTIEAEVRTFMETLDRTTRAKLCGVRRRPWGPSVVDGRFSSSIQDLAVSGLLVTGPIHDLDVDFRLLEGPWADWRQSPDLETAADAE